MDVSSKDTEDLHPVFVIMNETVDGFRNCCLLLALLPIFLFSVIVYCGYWLLGEDR